MLCAAVPDIVSHLSLRGRCVVARKLPESAGDLKHCWYPSAGSSALRIMKEVAGKCIQFKRCLAKDLIEYVDYFNLNNEQK